MTSPAPDPRYPIGTFHYDGPSSPQSRAELIAAIAALPTSIRSAAHGLTDAQLDTPYRDGGWTVRQVIHHVPDSHMNAYVRWKLALTEDNPTIKPYEQQLWARLADVQSVSVEVSLALLDALHERWVATIRGMDEQDFNRTYFHPEQQRAVTLHEVLAMYAWHGKHHTAHITSLRAREGWS